MNTRAVSLSRVVEQSSIEKNAHEPHGPWPHTHTHRLAPETDKARSIIQNILKELWPAKYRSATRFPLRIPDPRAAVGVRWAPSWGSGRLRLQGRIEEALSVVHAGACLDTGAMGLLHCRGFCRLLALPRPGMPLPMWTHLAAPAPSPC